MFRASLLDHGSSSAPTATSRFVDRRIHLAGVTAILPLSESLLLTGSYDDHVRLLEIPSSSQRGRVTELASLNLEGGVWRLKLLFEAKEGGDR